ncbi:hypothetical protein [uncultured Kocuria sp.]|uniref:hypothetical protein n=1 Tax=uncultured Kocuria sp. TaxID=259305 RepID=UPI0025980E5A|nr:hypothetical protein [uncultured Kocuria sp.]
MIAATKAPRTLRNTEGRERLILHVTVMATSSPHTTDVPAGRAPEGSRVWIPPKKRGGISRCGRGKTKPRGDGFEETVTAGLAEAAVSGRE